MLRRGVLDDETGRNSDVFHQPERDKSGAKRLARQKPGSLLAQGGVGFGGFEERQLDEKPVRPPTGSATRVPGSPIHGPPVHEATRPDGPRANATVAGHPLCDSAETVSEMAWNIVGEFDRRRP